MKALFLCLVLIFAIVSCEYKADGDNYRAMEPPAASIPLEINLNDVDPADTIYIMDVTRLTVKINTMGKTLKNLNYMLGNTMLNSYDGGVVIYPHDIGDGKYKLTVAVVVSSGTGSLADRMGMEGYAGEMSWNIRIISNFDPGLKLGFRKNAGDLLELYWETSAYIPKAIFEKYEISASKYLTVTNQDQRSVVLEDYVYGHTSNSVTLYLKCADGYSHSYSQSLSFNSPVPNLYFENLGVNLLRVYWDKPFIGAKYELSVMNSQIPGVMTSDTSVVVSQPPFTTARNYEVSMYPKNSTATETIYSIWGGYFLGNRGISAYDVDYYGARNKILAVNGGALYAVNLQTLIATDQINMVEPGGSYPKISCVPGSDKIAVKQKNSFFIYHNDHYINPVVVYRSINSFWKTDFFGLTNNDRLLIVDDEATNCDVYDANTGTLLFTFAVERQASRSASADGKYFCCASANGLTIYSIGASGVENTAILPGSYAKAIFNPANPQQLIVKKGNDIQVLEVPGFQPVYTLAATYSTLLDVDPANGNILYHRRYAQQDSLHVIGTTPAITPVFAVASERDGIKLKGNLLMDNSNDYFLDISPYLKP